MRREPTIPLFLWVATAALVHILWGGGAEQVVRVVEGGNQLAQFAGAVRQDVELRNRAVEVTLFDDTPQERPEPERDSERVEPPVPPSTEPSATPPPDPKTPDKAVKADKANKEPEKVDTKTPKDTRSADQTPPKTPEPPQPEKKKEESQKPVDAEQLKVLDLHRRIAVKQHVQDKNQKDNPTAEFLAEDANTTTERTRARITATDQNLPDPHPGVEHQGPAPEPGSAHVNETGQSDSSPGDPTRAFAQSTQDGKDRSNESRGQKQTLPENAAQAVYGQTSPRAQGETNGAQQSEGSSKAREAREAQAAAQAFDNTLDSAEGEQLLPAQSEAQNAQRAQAASRRRSPPKGQGGLLPNLRGLGSMALTPGGLNPNLTPMTALEAIGKDQLSQERLADGERRRAKHRGTWRQPGLEPWRAAIENYVASVQPGNQTALNTARSPFANYLNEIHNRLHDVFAFDFLPSLDNLPGDHPLNRKTLATHIEIVLSREDGRIVRMGVTRASGVTAFDVGALESVKRASPYGAPPREILSPDGNVYLHWEFWRDPSYACSTYFARPYILKFAPTPAPGPLRQPPPAQGTEEQHGQKQDPPNAAERGG